MLFSDDSPPNVAAARALGWPGLHFRDAATWRTELVKRGALG